MLHLILLIMPTKWKRYRCFLCQRTVVRWKLRVYRGRKVCHFCVEDLYEFSHHHHGKPPVKSEVIATAKITQVKTQSIKYPSFGE